MLANFAMRWRIYNGLIPGQTVNAHIKEAAHCQTQKGEEEYQKHFHGCLLWTYYRPEVNTWWVLLPRVASSVIASPDLSGRSNLGVKSRVDSFLFMP
jgi:hypothetical protein